MARAPIKNNPAVFLGVRRSVDADHAHDPGAGSLVPMGILALGCVAMALFPNGIAGFLVRAAHEWAPKMINTGNSIESLTPLHEMALLNARHGRRHWCGGVLHGAITVAACTDFAGGGEPVMWIRC